ncbi:MAG TPA: PilN domain-containing protein [Thermoanaerobaculia bacterium]|jgi:Tfp pilus assembly protein PilN|nr:PilN domain-containing protein [Thermoanaerobaculia bacterium]
MIKINLLSEGKRPAAVRKARTPGGASQDIALWMLLVGAFIGVLAAAGYWWYLNNKLKEKQEEVVQVQKEVDALQAVIKEVEDFKHKKKNLADKIAVINDLKSNQRGPVRIMDYVSRALPELLWLDRLRMNASTIEVEGRAFNPNAVANFMDNLDKVPEFKEPVLKDTSAQGNGVYKFFVTFDYSFAPPKKPEEGGAAPGTAKPGAPGSAPAPATPGAMGGPPGTAPPPSPPSPRATPGPATSSSR